MDSDEEDMMDTQQLSAALVTKSLNFHGQQLQKLWEGERGENDLIKLGVPVPDYTEYQVRQKFLNFQDRGKRLKLQQFIAKKATALFDAELLQDVPAATQTEEKDGEKLYAVMPPFELFMNLDKSQRLRHFFEVVKLGDHILGTIINKTTSGMMLKVLSSIGPTSRYVADINVKAFCPIGNTVPAFDSKKNVTRGYAVNDSVVCEILEVIPDTDKMVVGMKGTSRGPDEPPSKPPLGLIHNDDYPAIYKKAAEVKHESYNALLLKCPGFSNPSCTQYLADLMGLGTKHFSNMKGFRGRFPEQEYAIELRQVQASKWAFRSVAEGIEHFKAGRHTEAFQCLNKALNIDPRNVEGLVARGALYANTGSFKRAIEDFEMSLKLNPSHANARKYMGETLVALGRSFEEENKFDEARKAYQDCLAIIPFHEEALNSIEFLKNKSSSFKPLIDAGELLLPNLALSILEAGKDGTKSEDKKDKKKKKKSKSKKKRGNSSSSSSSSSSDSSNSSSSSSESSSDSSSSSADSEGNRGRKKKRTSREAVQGVKQRSLSPLSKRMALMDDTNTTYQFNKASSGFPAGHQGDYNIPKPPGPPPPDIKPDRDADYESKVRKFLEATRDDSDYEDKVRKFLDEARSFKKGKAPEDKSKKKKNKKDKSKAKKESRRKKREKEREEKKKLKALKRTKEFDLREFEAQMESKKFRDALRLEKELSAQKHGEMFGETTSMSTKKHRNRTASTDDEFVNSNKKDLDDLDELESKLNAYYAKMEKDSTSKRSDSQLSLPHEASPKPLGRDMRDFREVRQSRDMRELRDTRDTRDAYGKFSNKDSEPENKWKMNFGKESRFNKKAESKNQLIKSYPFEATSESDEDAKKSTAEIPLPAVDKSLGVRKVMSLKEPPPKKEDPPPKPVLNLNKPNVVLDKFGSFRLVETESAIKPGKVEGRRSRSRSKPRNYRTSSSRSRSGSRKRSKSGSYARKYSRSRSRSYHSRSRSRSRSRSHSRSYGSRSRSRSHSRRRFDRRLPNRGRGGYERGTYYKPRFNTGFNHQNNNRGGGFRGRGYRDNYDNRNFRGRGHRGNYNNGNFRPWGRGGGQRGGRFFNNRGGFRDYNNRDRRYDRRSRDRSEDRRSYSDDERKEREKRFDDKTLSEGEVEHDNSYVDDKEIEGKWADKSEVGKDEQAASTM